MAKHHLFWLSELSELDAFSTTSMKTCKQGAACRWEDMHVQKIKRENLCLRVLHAWIHEDITPRYTVNRIWFSLILNLPMDLHACNYTEKVYN